MPHLECPGCVQRFEHDGTDASQAEALSTASTHVHQFHRDRYGSTLREADEAVADYNRRWGLL